VLQLIAPGYRRGNPMEYETLAAAIRAARTRKEHTKTTAALEMGVSRMAFTRWEAGARFPPVEFRLRVAAYIGIEADVLNEHIDSEEQARGKAEGAAGV